MLRRLRRLWIKVLFRLLDGPTEIVESDKREKELIRQWMIDTYAHPGYQAFFKYRHAKFIISLSDLGMEDQPREKYIRVIGQRFEILRWNEIMRKVYEKSVQKKEENITKK